MFIYNTKFHVSNVSLSIYSNILLKMYTKEYCIMLHILVNFKLKK